ncbi:MAG TPA: adenylate kinase [Candidatus Paceibacterota bacterium]|nr:adenylate kinase [Verrucomicrobiota bacterium]HRY49904.1 adenylate kinase [Candidatus Paceibacterota bacterium]HSA01369.1 adenylate kinase [Candidatus Paceibacterota bacterium]
MNIAFIGPTCAGKSTQAGLLTGGSSLRHLSTGRVLRDNRDQMTALGLLAKKYMERGELVPDEVINAMIEEAVRKTPPEVGLLLDGFPSTLYQAKFLDTLFQECGRHLDAVFFLYATEKAIFERATHRLPRRVDDAPEILRNRLRVFRRNTAPVLQYYTETQRLSVLNAEPAVEVVSLALQEILDSLRQGQSLLLRPEDKEFIETVTAGPVPVSVLGRQSSLDLAIIGGPGTGKGTHASFLAAELKLPHIATGNLFRENLRRQSELGNIAKSYLDQGELVPDDITEAMVRQRLSRPDTMRGFILDGFPRTLPQVRALDEIMSDLRRHLDGVILLTVPDDIIVERVGGRRICRKCQAPYHVIYRPPKVENVCDLDGAPLDRRDDDDPETVRARLRAYHGQTMPAVEHYRNQGLIREISAMGEVLETRQQLLAAVIGIVRKSMI